MYSTPPNSPRRRGSDDDEATTTPSKYSRRPPYPFGATYLTPQPNTAARFLRDSDDDDNSSARRQRGTLPFSKTRVTPPRYSSPQPKGLRPRESDSLDDVEALRLRLARTETVVFRNTDRSPESEHQRRSGPRGRDYPTFVGTNSDRSTPVSTGPFSSNRMLWESAMPHETPTKPPNHTPRISIASSAAATGPSVPNRNPFTPGKGQWGAAGSHHHHHHHDDVTLPVHCLIVNHEMTHAAPQTRAATVSQSASMTPAPRGVSGSASRYCFRHHLPWLEEDEQAEGGEYVPLHQDVNGTVWLANGLVDGVPYAVKEVVQSPHCYGGYSAEAQKLLAADPAIATEVAALVLSAKCRYIQRYYSVQHDMTRGIHVIRAEYCPRGTLYEDVLTHYMAVEDRPSTPVNASNVVPRFQLPPEAELWKVLGQVYKGLSVLHDHGIAHNALTPRTVLVDDLGDCRITNFGAACRVTDDLDVSSIPPAIPVIYEPLQSSTWMEGESPYTRDVYTFAAGLVHLILLAQWQINHGRPVHETRDTDAHVMPSDVSMLGRLGYSPRLVHLFERLLRTEPSRRPTAQQVVQEIRTPTASAAALLGAVDMEAVRLRSHIAELTKTMPRVFQRSASVVPPSITSRRGSWAPPPPATAISRGVSMYELADLQHNGPHGESLIPLLGTVSPPIRGNADFVPQQLQQINSGTVTAPRSSLKGRPTEHIMLSSSTLEGRPDVTSPLQHSIRDVMSPTLLNGSYTIRRDRVASFLLASISERGNTRTPPAESPTLLGGSTRARFSRDPFPNAPAASFATNPSFILGSAALGPSPNRFDTAHMENGGGSVEATPAGLKGLQGAPVVSPPPTFVLPNKLALSPNEVVREATSVALFSDNPATHSPVFSNHVSPSRLQQHRDTATPQHESPATRAQLAPDPLDLDDDDELKSVYERCRPRDAHYASVREIVTLLQRRMPDLTLSTAPLQDGSSPPRSRS